MSDPIHVVATKSHVPSNGLYAESTSFEGHVLLNLIERWGLVAGKAGKEDSAGRATLTLQTPEELVERAVATTQLAIAALRREGWIAANPVLTLIAEDERQRKAEEAERKVRQSAKAETAEKDVAGKRL